MASLCRARGVGFKCSVLMALFYHSCRAKPQTAHQLIHTPSHSHSHPAYPNPHTLMGVFPTAQPCTHAHTGISTSAFPPKRKSVVVRVTWNQLFEVYSVSFYFGNNAGSFATSPPCRVDCSSAALRHPESYFFYLSKCLFFPLLIFTYGHFSLIRCSYCAHKSFSPPVNDSCLHFNFLLSIGTFIPRGHVWQNLLHLTDNSSLVAWDVLRSCSFSSSRGQHQCLVVWTLIIEG